MFHKFLFIGLFVIGLGAILHLVGCNHGKVMHHSAKCHKSMLDRIVKKTAKECDLNEMQKAKLADLKETFVQEHKPMFEHHKSNFEQLITQIEKEALDQEKFNQAFEEGIAKKQKIHQKMVAKFAEFHATLNPEQKRKLATLLRNHHDKMTKHFGYGK